MVGQEDDSYIVDQAVEVPSRQNGLRQIIPMVLLGAGVLGLLLIGFVAYQQGKDSRKNGEIPTVKASAEPYKIKPENPGGMEIPNTDKQVFENLVKNPETKDNKAETILMKNTVEQPISREQLKSEAGSQKPEERNQKAEDLAKTAVKPVKETEQVIAKELPIKDIPVIAPRVIKPSSEPVKEAKVKRIEPTRDIAIRTDSGTSNSKGGYRLQLGAYKSESEAITSWEAIKKKHSAIIGNFEYDIEKADLKEKGIFFRLRVGSISGKSEAELACKKLITAKQGCFVVKTSKSS